MEKQEMSNKVQSVSNLSYGKLFIDSKQTKGSELINLDRDIEIPINVFSNSGLSSLHTIVKYLKEDCKMKYSEIARLINRDQRTIWGSYANSQKRMSKSFVISSDSNAEIKIPVSIIFDRKLSILEAITVYLKEIHALRYSKIARLISRDQRTIWTAYKRANIKRKSKIMGKRAKIMRNLVDNKELVDNSIVDNDCKGDFKNEEY